MKTKMVVILTSLTILCFCISCSNSNQERRFVEMKELDFGAGTYRPNPFKFLDNLPPFSWMGMPDSVKKGTLLEIAFNEDAIRTHSSGQLIFVDQNNNIVKGLSLGKDRSESTSIDATADKITLPVYITVNPAFGDTVLHGSVCVISKDIDQVNDTKLTSIATPIASWKITQRTGINWVRWIILIFVVILILYILLIISGIIRSALIATTRFLSRIFRRSNKSRKVKSRIISRILRKESRLYKSLSVAEKYAILEEIRLELDRLYLEDRKTYDIVRAALKPNTWDALEENWKLWNPVPKSHVVWEGPNKFTCRLEPSHPRYQECAAKGFTVCQYDEHGSPDFDAVTSPGSVVDISDLYDKLSSENIQKRGGSAHSLQEIAQERMVKNLKPAIDAWARKNNREADFWQWRDSHDLVPHEDTDCRTMRLVYRPVHLTFKHRGGVANAVNIKTHFP